MTWGDTQYRLHRSQALVHSNGAEAERIEENPWLYKRVHPQVWNHRKIMGKSSKQILENVGPLLGHVYGKFMENMCLKAPGNYYGRVWSYNFSICLWESLKPQISMISGFMDVSPSPKTNYFYLWKPQDTSNTPRQFPNRFRQIMFL